MRKHIIVNLKLGRVYYYEEECCQSEYPAGSGKPDTPTPPGHYKVVDKLIFADSNASEVDLGSRRLVLSSDKTCLHGSWHGPVEGQVSGGCVRMHNADIEELFEKVEIGTPVFMIEG